MNIMNEYFSVFVEQILTCTRSVAQTANVNAVSLGLVSISIEQPMIYSLRFFFVQHKYDNSIHITYAIGFLNGSCNPAVSDDKA